MKLHRQQVGILLNALYDAGIDRFSIAHPADGIGDLVEVRLGHHRESDVRFVMDKDDYAKARNEVNRQYGSPAVDDLPAPRAYLSGAVASGIVELPNENEIQNFLDRYGSPDLNAGHRPVFAGFDTNLLPWRMADVLGLREEGYWNRELVVNGFALATGVRDELDWDHKHGKDNVRRLQQAFGDSFSEFFNQPAGANRQGRLGEIHYRQLRDHQYADEIECSRGDEAIVNGYDVYQQEGRKDVLLFSNDRNFVERARSHRVLSQHIAFPQNLPKKTTASWDAIVDLVYMYAILFGIIRVPKIEIYGVWAGKEGQAWQDEELKIDCRSPPMKVDIKRGKQIAEEYQKIVTN